MASVSAVSSTDFRANLAPQQNNASDESDPFSLLLNAVTDVKAGVREPDAPPPPERRDDVPARQPKPEADDRQAKRQAKDTDRPEATAQAEQTAAPVTNDDDSDDTETDTDSDDTASAEALLALALVTSEQQQVAPPQVAADATATVTAQAAGVAAVATNTEATVAIQTPPALAAAVADAAVAASAETQPVQAAQTAASAKAQFELAPVSTQTETEAEIALPKITAETISSLLKPAKAESPLDAKLQTQTQPGSVNVASATALHGPAPLETLQAAISKHVQLSLGLDANETAPDAHKPLISSNAVAPNFALASQTAAPVNIQTQTAAEVSRAVPLDQLAVEIATRAGKGERRFDIRLDPPELGRIDVRLEIDSKGNTTTKLIVERAETLDMLQRDARGLEKALQNAGLKTDAGGLQFSLQQDTQTSHGQQNHAPETRGRPDLVQAEAEIMAEIPVGNAALAAQIRGGVDIRI